MRQALPRFVAVSLALMASLYALLYYPYDEGALTVKVLSRYLELTASACASVIGLWDPSVRVLGTSVRGRFSLQIVLDCAALDVQALLVATVIAFPARWRARAAGVAVGLAAITLANLLRIVMLYFIGARWPSSFHVWHEEVMQFAIVMVAVAAFGAWALRVRRAPRESLHAA